MHFWSNYHQWTGTKWKIHKTLVSDEHFEIGSKILQPDMAWLTSPVLPFSSEHFL
jgi:hypothetical protein